MLEAAVLLGENYRPGLVGGEFMSLPTQKTLAGLPVRLPRMLAGTPELNIKIIFFSPSLPRTQVVVD